VGRKARAAVLALAGVAMPKPTSSVQRSPTPAATHRLGVLHTFTLLLAPGLLL
jgi:hypothetical protein